MNQHAVLVMVIVKQGQIAREEANAAQVAWNKASQEAAQKWDAEMKRQSKGLSAAISGYQSDEQERCNFSD